MQWHQSRMTGIRESLKEKAKLTDSFTLPHMRLWFEVLITFLALSLFRFKCFTATFLEFSLELIL